MSKISSIGAITGLFCAGAAWWPFIVQGATHESAAPDFALDSSMSWVPDRINGDDFLPPPSGPGPVMAEKDHPYIPNNPDTQPTYRIADLSNPILKPWVVERMKKPNDEVRAGKVP